LWNHPFPQSELHELKDWIRREEEHRALINLQVAISQQIKRLKTRSPAAIAAALGETPERIAEIMRDEKRHYRGLS
jgi:hypothetical protein